ncbi:MAG: GAF domain-containing protein [Gaiellaceae bacterium]
MIMLRLALAVSAATEVVAGAALIGAVLLLALWLRERCASHAREVRRTKEIDRELGAVAELSARLARADDVESIARLLIDEVVGLLRVDFAAVALICEDGTEAHGLVARGADDVGEWWPSVRFDLVDEPSLTAAAVAEGIPVQSADVATDPKTNRRLAERVGAKSAVFVPVKAQEHVEAVLICATTQRHRVFGGEELALLQALAAEAALALGRTRSAAALEEALERERLVARIGRRVRSELDVGALLRVAVEELAREIGVTRAFIRLGEGGGDAPVLAEWDAPGAGPVGDTTRLPALNLAARDRRTVAVEDIETARELQDESLGSVDVLRELGVRAVLATPIVVFDRTIGVFGLHRGEPGAWTAGEVALAEAVAREAGLAIHTARLLEENRLRAEQQAGLLHAAQVVTRELRVETVLERLVVELAQLLDAEAADLFVVDAQRDVLRCVAAHGFDVDVVGYELESGLGLAGRVLEVGGTVRADEYEALEIPVPHPTYRGFSAAMASLLVWSGERRGVLGVGSRTPGRRFTESDAQILETFAGLAALALGNAEAFERSERQARVERGFYRVAALLGEPVSLDRTFDALAHAACEAFGADTAFVLTPGTGGLEPAGGHGGDRDEARALATALAGTEAVENAVRSRRLLASGNVADDARFPDGFRELARRRGDHSLLTIPVELPRRDAAGVALVLFREPHTFTDADLELAGHLGGAARGALERAELYERERTSRALAQQLASRGSLLAAERDPQAVLDELAEQGPPLLGAQAAVIRLLDGDELVAAAASGEGAATLGARSALAGTPSGDVVHTRLPVAVADAAAEGLTPDDDPMLGAGYRAYLGVPLFAAERELRGALAIYSREPRDWREEEVEALEALAAAAAAVLGNAELYQQVALQKDRSDAILANVADGIVAVDHDDVVVLWNRAAEQITGVPQLEALGRPLARVLQRDLGPPGEAERLVPIRRGAEQVWLSISEAIMRDPAGEVAGRVYAFRDVSSERMVEQMKSTFVSTVSQELRRPLTSIYGFAETLLRRDVQFNEEDRRSFLGYIASEAERLTAIVDQLLSVARLEAGDLKVELTPTDVRTVVAEVVHAIEASGNANGHRFVVELPEEPLDASVDPDKLRQIIDALVGNAVKYSPGGGTVTVAALRRSDAVEVRVADEGVGIPTDEQERIFSKFYRTDTSRSGGGTGLGLFIAQGLVSAMGGRIWIDSETGQGATFVFELPVARGRSPVTAE